LICIKQQDYCLFDKKGKRMSTYINSPKNLLIDALCLETQRRLFPHLEVVHLEMGEVIAESGDVMKNVYFPIDSIVSLLYDTREGNSTEISLVGNEGFVGIALFMGGDSTPSRAVVQSAGNAYRLSSSLCCVTFNHYLHKWRRQLCAIDTIQLINNFVVFYY
jgi:hypothetical protein